MLLMVPETEDALLRRRFAAIDLGKNLSNPLEVLSIGNRKLYGCSETGKNTTKTNRSGRE